MGERERERKRGEKRKKRTRKRKRNKPGRNRHFPQICDRTFNRKGLFGNNPFGNRGEGDLKVTLVVELLLVVVMVYWKMEKRGEKLLVIHKKKK